MVNFFYICREKYFQKLLFSVHYHYNMYSIKNNGGYCFITHLKNFHSPKTEKNFLSVLGNPLVFSLSAVCFLYVVKKVCLFPPHSSNEKSVWCNTSWQKPCLIPLVAFEIWCASLTRLLIEAMYPTPFKYSGMIVKKKKAPINNRCSKNSHFLENK